MRIAVTGATGFLGRYIVARLTEAGHSLRCQRRESSDVSNMPASPHGNVEWSLGELGDVDAGKALVDGCDAVVHSALHRAGSGFMGAEGDVATFAEKNIVGTLRLIQAARDADVARFVFISTCAVHDEILDDRPLDEKHPLWAKSHYGAHKAAIEKFVHSYGLGDGFPICAVRPTGIYGVAHPPESSKWYELVAAVVRGESVNPEGGGKEVHAADVARAVELLLNVDEAHIIGQAFNCTDRYVSQHEVAVIANELASGNAEIGGGPSQPKHQIVTDKIKALGMKFGGEELLRQTIGELIEVVS